MMRSFTIKERPAGTAKAAFARLIDACGGFSAAARISGVRVGKTALYNYSDEDDAENRDKFAPMDVIEVLERACGQPLASEYLAAAAGHVLLKINMGSADPALDEDMARVGERFAALFADYAGALGDGQVDRPEAKRLIERMDELLRRALHARSRLMEKYHDE